MKTMALSIRMNPGKMLFRHIYLLAAALSLTGCATGSTRVDLSQIEAPPPEKARVFVIRPKYQYGAALSLQVSANGTHIATLDNLSYTSFLVSPGKLTLANEGASWPRKELTIVTEGGKTYYLSWTLKDVSGLGSLLPFAAYAVSTSSIHWEELTKQDAQTLLESTNQVPASVAEIPQAK